jgi:hypothetical protein
MKKKPQKKFGMRIAGKGEYVGARSFDETLHDTLDLLQEIDRNVSGVEDVTLQWEIVEASVKSPLFIGLAAIPIATVDNSDRVVDVAIDGIESLDSSARVPSGFSPKAIQAVKRITDHFGNGVLKVSFSSPSRTITPSYRVAQNVARIINQPVAESGSSKSYSERGTVEGIAENLIGREHYFSLYDILSGKRIKCTFPESIREDVRAAWGKRVVVDGLIHYAADGTPERVAATMLTPKPDRSLLPQFKGKYINITGGIESSEYVRGMRDDD